jgi:hypothetical protein
MPFSEGNAISRRYSQDTPKRHPLADGYFFLYSCGVIPNCFLKHLEK